MPDPSSVPNGRDPVPDWITEAHGGSAEALGRLIAHCRKYLLHIANQEMDPTQRAREGPSDMVQQTCLEAVRDFAQFRGRTEAELLGWLSCILDHKRRNAIRHRNADKRCATREVPLDAGGSSVDLLRDLPDDCPSPSHHLQRQEREQMVQEALQRLPEDYRQAILWHHREGCSYEEIGRRLGRSAEAARKLWTRAVQRLKEELRCCDE